MEKPEQISHEHPNAASKDAVDDAKRRVVALGIEWHEAIDKAEISRPTGFRLLAGKASVASLRRLEDWLAKEEAKRPRRPKPADSPIEDWKRLGEELAQLDPPQFSSMLEGLRDLVHAEKQRQAAKDKMFRVNPDRSR